MTYRIKKPIGILLPSIFIVGLAGFIAVAASGGAESTRSASLADSSEQVPDSSRIRPDAGVNLSEGAPLGALPACVNVSDNSGEIRGCIERQYAAR